MDTVRGVDGCPGGWLCISLDLSGGRPVPKVFPDARALFNEPASVTAIDIPTGLPKTGARRCDLEARRLLGPRRSSVFPAPVRSVLSADSYATACAASIQACGKKVSKQTYAICDKIRDIDMLLQQSSALVDSVREVHPEVCFFFWNGRRPMRHPKKSRFGFAERFCLLQAFFGAATEEVREAVTRKQASDDDILDAFAALWSAQRIQGGSAERVTTADECDEFGLPMQIWA